MQHILAQNLSPVPQTAWTFVGMPAADVPTYPGGLLTDGLADFPFITEQHGIRVLLSLPAMSDRIRLDPVKKYDEVAPFAWHPVIAEHVMQILPEYRYGDRLPDVSNLQLLRAGAASQVYLHRLLWQAERIVLDVHYTIATMSPTIEFVATAIYGNTTNDGQAQSILGQRLSMFSRARLHADFAVRNGQAPAQRMTDGRWQLDLVAQGRRWHRASRWETRGAVMPMHDAGRTTGLPMQAIYSGWDGDWLALGKVPARTADLLGVRSAQRSAYLAPRAGDYTDARPRSQPRESGTTGDQADFGASSDLGVVAMEPWEVHDALWQCQAYGQRPTGNREPNGEPMRARLHPQAQTHNQRPDLSLGVADRLGWPGVNQIAWIPSPATCTYTTSDDEHRADLLLHATIALTRDPALEAIVQDHIELDGTNYYVQTRQVPAARAVGRMALARANQVWLGFRDAVRPLMDQLDAAVETTPLNTLPDDRPVRTIGGRSQAKYGWNDHTGQPVIGWQPWQEAIAAIGMLAGARVMRREVAGWSNRMIDFVEMVARSAVQQGYLQATDGAWRHAYAVRWNDGNAFSPASWPVTSIGQEGQTGDVYVSNACRAWTAAALVIRSQFEELAETILAREPLNTIADARWRALPRITD
jgi:hypothetical protein